jgi:hypothetical protein
MHAKRKFMRNQVLIQPLLYGLDSQYYSAKFTLKAE